MNAKRQIQALNNYKWGEKSQKQVASYVSKKLDMLGYKVPKYLKEGKITQSQLDTQLNKIYNKLEKIQEKQHFNSLSRVEQNKIRNERRLEKAIIDYNVKVLEIREHIEGDNSLSDKMKQYLLGGATVLNTRDKAFYNDKVDLHLIDRNNLKFNSFSNTIKMIKGMTKNLGIGNVLKQINDSKAEDEYFVNELLGSEIMRELTEHEKDILKRAFDNLNAPQKALFIKDRLNELKEKYERMLAENEDIFDFNHSTQAMFNTIIKGVDVYGEF